VTVDRLLNRTAVACVVLAIGSVSWQIQSRRPHPVYQVGEVINDLHEIQFETAPTTVVLWLNTRCQPCHDSLPLYRAIAKQAKHTRLVVVGPESQEELSAFLAEDNLRVSQVVSVGRRHVRLWRTPTIMSVTRAGVVKAVTVGLIEKFEDQQRWLATID
jgi:hypothetical protein